MPKKGVNFDAINKPWVAHSNIYTVVYKFCVFCPAVMWLNTELADYKCSIQRTSGGRQYYITVATNGCTACDVSTAGVE